MKRYILTEDRIFDLTEIVGYHNIVNAYNEKGEKAFEYLDLNSKGRFKIIKKADTIEELCEKNYCIVEWRNGIETICPYDLAQTLMVNCPDKINGAYLCVFTPTGLTKVARITENGGAELL